MPKTLHIHVGAHKTATTRLQAALVCNASTLRDRGVAVFCPPRQRFLFEYETPYDTSARYLFPTKILRRKFTAEINATWRRFGNRYRLSKLTEDLIVLSEENLLSATAGYPIIGPLYPRARRNMRILRRALPICPRRIFLGVRDYSSFYNSLYAEAARYSLLPSEDDVRDSVSHHIVKNGGGWHTVYASLADVFPEATIEVWRHESLDESRRLSAILGGRAKDLDAPPASENKRLSRQAIELIQSKRAFGKQARKVAQEDLSEEYIELFSSTDRQNLYEIYLRDIEKMRQLGAHVADY